MKIYGDEVALVDCFAAFGDEVLFDKLKHYWLAEPDVGWDTFE